MATAQRLKPLDAIDDRWTRDEFQRVLTDIDVGIVTAIGIALGLSFEPAPEP